jgi:hypothetical protein
MAVGSPFLWLLSFGEAKESSSASGPKPGKIAAFAHRNAMTKETP